MGWECTPLSYGHPPTHTHTNRCPRTVVMTSFWRLLLLFVFVCLTSFNQCFDYSSYSCLLLTIDVKPPCRARPYKPQIMQQTLSMYLYISTISSSALSRSFPTCKCSEPTGNQILAVVPGLQHATLNAMTTHSPYQPSSTQQDRRRGMDCARAYCDLAWL